MNYSVQANFNSLPKQHQLEHYHSSTSWVEIDVAAFTANISAYKKILQGTSLACVVKANAYGHGIDIIAPLCDKNPLVDILCTVSLSEALKLRLSGIKKRILVLSIIDQEVHYALEYGIDLVVYSRAHLIDLNTKARIFGTKARVHLKVDTGLSRIGLLPEDAYVLALECKHFSHIDLVGIFSHFADAESDDQSYVNQQLNIFNQFLARLKQQAIMPSVVHTSCSAAVAAQSNSWYTLGRVGIGLYGLWPSEQNKVMTLKQYPTFALTPVLSWKTKIIQIKEIPAGSFVGYDRTHQVNRFTRTAVLPLGYWDGYDRQLSNKGKVLIGTVLVPILGRVAMNLTVVDVTDVHAAVGDSVTVLGNYPGIRAEDLAMYCDTINYEIVTRINPLLPRFVI